MLRQLIQGVAIGGSAAGLVPHRMNFPDDATASFRLGRWERLVWLFVGVEYRLSLVLPEPSPGIAGVEAPGRMLPYYRPQLFVDRDVPPESWEAVATGRTVTSQCLIFRGAGLNIRLPCDAVRHWEPYCDGWFSYNLARNLAAL